MHSAADMHPDIEMEKEFGRVPRDVTFREEVRQEDVEAVRDIVVSSGFFNHAEVDIAMELVEERLAKGGPESGYYFLFAERKGQVVGYTCFGPVPGTQASFELYWIAVHNEARGLGLGKKLVAQSEKTMVKMGAGRIYADTSSREQYEPTRLFYNRCGFMAEAVLKDFYGPEDSKVIFVKILPAAAG